MALSDLARTAAGTRSTSGPQPTSPDPTAPSAGRGLSVPRRFTTPGVHPYSEVTWELRTSAITNERGEVVFQQTDVEIPKAWSQTATNVVVSKYFRGALGSPKRERSVKQLIDRVANTISDWGIKDGYFASPDDAETFRAELTHLLVNQQASFNSPVWFNVGIEPKPQCSACQPYHALVNTVHGPRPIGEIVTKNLVGLPVYDGNGLTQVVAVKHNGRKPVYRVTLNDGFSIEATPDHFVCAHDTRRTQRLEWRRVDALKPGMMMRVYPHAAETVTATAPTNAVAEAALAGWLQADGFVGQYAEGASGVATLELAVPEVQYSEIVAIEPLGEMEVYDIQTGSGQYLTNSVLVHNCFILSVKDTMESILDWYKVEGMIFKYGSGSGINLSTIRSSQEALAGGGTASGPVSFMRAADASAGVIKSGGKTRRAAKMVVLNADHPDVKKFILCKWQEEKKAWALVDAGFDSSIDGEAYGSVFFQNANNSVRATDAFMQAVLEDKDWTLKGVLDGQPVEMVKARDLMRLIAEATWHCGDPGMQFDTTINDWHTCPNTGRINASNPCSEYMSLDDSACLGPEVRVSTKQGLLPVAELYRRQEAGEAIYVKTELLSEHAAVPRHGKRGYRPSDVYARQLALRPAVVIKTGRKFLYRIELSTGQTIRLTADHKVLTEEGWKEVRQLQIGRDAIVTQKQSVPIDYSEASQEEIERSHMLGWMLGDGYCSDNGERSAFGLVFGPQDRPVAEYLRPIFNRYIQEQAPSSRTVGISTQANGVMQMGSTAHVAFRQLVEEYGVHPATAPDKRVPSCVFQASKVLQAAFLGALFSADGTIYLRKPGAVNKSYLLARLSSSSPQLLSDVQCLLFDFGIRSSIAWTHPEGRKNPQGTLSIHGHHAYKFCQMIGFPLSEHKRHTANAVLSEPYGGHNYAGRRAMVERIEEDGVDDVYDISEPVTHSMIAEGMIIHNCNLASLNLMRFTDADGTFRVEEFRHAVRVVTLAQDIIVDNSSYPTPKIGETAKAYRQLGLGYANLGALLMSLGVPYDSDAGRAYAAALTALTCGEAYRMSTLIAEAKGPYTGFAANREPQLRVIRKHRDALAHVDDRLVPEPVYRAAAEAWDDALRIGTTSGVRNSQVTVLAPTGTIGFMLDCDTTGIEPDIALIKYKKLVGGGLLKIVNQTVPRALARLGYTEAQSNVICRYLDEQETIEGAPGFKPEHMPVFDCAFKAVKGTRAIHYLGHVRMMGAVQPFISGAISKTVNVPADATVEDIQQAYIESWKLGVKAVAIYRDGSKRVQPLSTGGKTEKPADDAEAPAVEEKIVYKPIRHYLADERHAITHKFSIAGHDGYVTVGLYEDGAPGEIFIVMSKEGTVISGLLDAFATAISLALQYGVPLEALVKKYSHMRFEPAGITSNPQIRFASSILDYVFRWMALKFLPPEKQPAAEAPSLTAPATGPKPSSQTVSVADVQERQAFQGQVDAPPCPDCGSMMVRNGNCYKCFNCGSTSGCS